MLKAEKLLPIPITATELVNLFLKTNNAMLTRGNDIQIFQTGQEKFDALLADIQKAKHHIHLEYFTIFDDNIGQKLIQLLTQKAREGVEVRIIYDQFGSHGRHDRLYRPLRRAGGIAIPF